MALSKFLDPKFDLSFKRVFGTEKNKNILIHLLNDILGFTIQDVEFLSTIMNPEIASDKQSIVDVLCKDSYGNRYIVEMQLARDKGFEKCAQLYAAKAYSRQSGSYIDFKKVFFIAISNSMLFFPEVEYISTHNIREIKTNGHYLKDFQFVFIELPKFTKNRVEQLESTVERWVFFFQYADNTTDEDLKDIAEKAPIIKLAYDELDKFSWNEKDLAAYEERVLSVQKEAAIWEQRLDDARDEGIQIGPEKGRDEGIQIGQEKGRDEGILIGKEKGKMKAKIAVAKNLLKAGLSIDLIAESTGLPKAEIEQLQEELA